MKRSVLAMTKLRPSAAQPIVSGEFSDWLSHLDHIVRCDQEIGGGLLGSGCFGDLFGRPDELERLLGVVGGLAVGSGVDFPDRHKRLHKTIKSELLALAFYGHFCLTERCLNSDSACALYLDDMYRPKSDGLV